ncbi:MAG: glutamyl-tRNA reductase [Gammaproteobacteria bacterium]|nr:glutamyl-tRNA reductase [Gammaproteobacteria bacterium]
MSLLTLGINHQTAPVEIREKVTFAPDQMVDALHQAVALNAVNEAIIVSTCNRTELYCEVNEQHDSAVSQWLSDFHHLQHDELVPYLYQYKDQEATRHLFRVASGLDSLVLGEPQILGQLKTAFETACASNTVKTVLGRLFQHGFTVAKKVRTDTAIGSNPVSVAFAAVSLSKQIFGDLSPLQALMIGAGETIELAARHLHGQQIGHITIANRTLERAQDLAVELGGDAITIGEIPEQLAQADIVISSTASPLPILGKGATEAALKKRRHRPIFMVDLAVPRDIEPQVGDLNDVYLYTVDDLKEVIDENRRSREEAANEALDIIQTEVQHFDHWIKTHQSADEIRLLRSNADNVKRECLKKAQAMLENNEDPGKVLESLAANLTNKLMHGPTIEMRKALKEEDQELIQLLHDLINHN